MEFSGKMCVLFRGLYFEQQLSLVAVVTARLGSAYSIIVYNTSVWITSPLGSDLFDNLLIYNMTYLCMTSKALSCLATPLTVNRQNRNRHATLKTVIDLINTQVNFISWS